MLTDGSVSHKVSIWGELAVAVNESYHQPLEEPIIAIIASTKLTMFNNAVQIGTLPSSKIYLNLNFDAVTELRSRLKEEGYKSSKKSSQIANTLPTGPSIEKISLKDLIENSSSMYAKKSLLCTFTILKIDDEENWWYYNCIKCTDEEVERDVKKFKCQNYKRSYPHAEKRFRIFVLVEDQTHACNIILKDRVVKRIVGNTATNLIKENEKAIESNSMPTVLKDIVGNEVTVKLVLTEANVKADSNIYEALDLCDSSVATSSIAEYSPVPKCLPSNHCDTIEAVDLFNTQ
ncbi:hypothetical protein POM88_008252 [Heracleum sosnowskyi]|uniref:Replication factor A C-terminal domain-containing protein n=1 Tax=Heracleum sosnowskyi TaxID=360622 RepID=A0AAD8N6B3_9APIA|nr:hypothetical protein POM88_008252 [Heracleum sosnowskyi]